MLRFGSAILVIIGLPIFIVMGYFLANHQIQPDAKWAYADLIVIILTAVAVILTALAIGLALMAFVGYQAIRDFATEAARRTAETAAKDTAQVVADATAREVAGRAANAYFDMQGRGADSFIPGAFSEGDGTNGAGDGPTKDSDPE